jgi:hypothetical protein
LIICIFDPADEIIGAKVMVFVAIWFAMGISVLLSREDITLPPGLVMYITGFVAIPLLSIICYYAFDGRQPFEGFAMLKGYFLVSLAIVLVLSKIDLLPQLCAVLTILASLVIALFIAIWLEPGLYDTLKSPAEAAGLLILDRRIYGDNFEFLQVYFVTTPMLVISIAYYFDRAMSVRDTRRKLLFSAVAGINIAGMFLAGSRNNIFVSVLQPFLLWPLYTRRPALYLFCSFAALALATLPFADYLAGFLDPAESANTIKLAIIQDYSQIFGDPVTLLFGQGLGAYQLWSGKPFEPFAYITELTYLEMLRNFGLVGAIAMMGLLLFPAGSAARNRDRKDISLAIAWLLYLVMCASNPNLFSSMGMLILAALIANIFQARDRKLGVAKRDFLD